MDYKSIISTYGEGYFADFIHLFLPNAKRQQNDLIWQLKSSGKGGGIISVMKSHRVQFPEFYSHPFYPEKDGLLPFGELETHDVLCWRTKGELEDWSIVILSLHGDTSQDFEMGIVEFLVRLFEKRLDVKDIPLGEINVSKGFDPI